MLLPLLVLLLRSPACRVLPWRSVRLLLPDVRAPPRSRGAHGELHLLPGLLPWLPVPEARQAGRAERTTVLLMPRVLLLRELRCLSQQVSMLSFLCMMLQLSVN
jgi:hypothetical protein